MNMAKSTGGGSSGSSGARGEGEAGSMGTRSSGERGSLLNGQIGKLEGAGTARSGRAGVKGPEATSALPAEALPTAAECAEASQLVGQQSDGPSGPVAESAPAEGGKVEAAVSESETGSITPQTDASAEGDALASDALQLEQIQVDAQELFESTGSERTRFSLHEGNYEDGEFKAEFTSDQLAQGKVEGEDFATQFRMEDADGNVYYADAVDLENDILYECKCAELTNTQGDLIVQHAKQLEAYIKAYEQTTGRPLKEIVIVTYPSTKDLWSDALTDAAPPADGEAAPSEAASARKVEGMLKDLRDEGFLYQSEAELLEDQLYYESLKNSWDNL
jgi:hypothetical protein